MEKHTIEEYRLQCQQALAAGYLRRASAKATKDFEDEPWQQIGYLRQAIQTAIAMLNGAK